MRSLLVGLTVASMFVMRNGVVGVPNAIIDKMWEEARAHQMAQFHQYLDDNRRSLTSLASSAVELWVFECKQDVTKGRRRLSDTTPAEEQPADPTKPGPAKPAATPEFKNELAAAAEVKAAEKKVAEATQKQKDAETQLAGASEEKKTEAQAEVETAKAEVAAAQTGLDAAKARLAAAKAPADPAAATPLEAEATTPGPKVPDPAKVPGAAAGATGDTADEAPKVEENKKGEAGDTAGETAVPPTNPAATGPAAAETGPAAAATGPAAGATGAAAGATGAAAAGAASQATAEQCPLHIGYIKSKNKQFVDNHMVYEVVLNGDQWYRGRMLTAAHFRHRADIQAWYFTSMVTAQSNQAINWQGKFSHMGEHTGSADNPEKDQRWHLVGVYPVDE